MKTKKLHKNKRSCVICREKFEKNELSRIARTADNKIEYDESKKMSGRGCYVCDSSVCKERLSNGKAVANALKISVSKEDIENILKKIR